MANYKNFKSWAKENNIEFPETDIINGQWFVDNGLPMIVECTCCGSTMALPSAYLDENDYIYCSSCIGA